MDWRGTTSRGHEPSESDRAHHLWNIPLHHSGGNEASAPAADDVARVGALTLTRDAHIIVIGTRRANGLNTMFLAALHP